MALVLPDLAAGRLAAGEGLLLLWLRGWVVRPLAVGAASHLLPGHPPCQALEGSWAPGAMADYALMLAFQAPPACEVYTSAWAARTDEPKSKNHPRMLSMQGILTATIPTHRPFTHPRNNTFYLVLCEVSQRAEGLGCEGMFGIAPH